MSPLIMKAIIKTVLELDELMMKVMSAYVNDICLTNDIQSAIEVKNKL